MVLYLSDIVVMAVIRWCSYTSTLTLTSLEVAELVTIAVSGDGHSCIL